MIPFLLLWVILLGLPSAAFAQALPWDAAYSAATRTTTIAVTNVAAGAAAANAGSFTFAAAANGDYMLRAVGSVPGPVSSATISATGTVSRSVLGTALGVAIKATPYVALGTSVYQLYQAYGAYMAETGFVIPETMNNQFWTSSSNDAGTRYSSFAGLVAAKYLEYQATLGPPYRAAGYDIKLPANYALCQNPMGAACALVKREKEIEEWDGQKMVRTGRYEPDGYAIAIKGFIGTEVIEVNPPADISRLIALGVNHRTGQVVNPDLAPAAQEIIAKSPILLPNPVRMTPEALPSPQTSPWVARPRVASDPIPDPVVQTRTRYVPRLAPDGSIKWDAVPEFQSPEGGPVVEGDPESAPGTDSPESVNPPANPNFSDLPSLYTKKYPDGLAGVWASRQAEFAQTPAMAWLSGLVPSIGSGGCPAWSFAPGDVLGVTVSGDISVPCYVWSAVRLFFVITALAVCRRLIFGG